MDEKLRKKRLQFAKRRDVGEQITIADLPASLIEASKKVLAGDEKKADEPRKIAVKAPYRSHITMYPKDESGTKIRFTAEQEEILGALLEALIEANFTPDDIVEFFSDADLISEGIQLVCNEFGPNRPEGEVDVFRSGSSQKVSLKEMLDLQESDRRTTQQLNILQRRRYAQQKGERPPSLEKGQMRYNITQKEKNSLDGIFSKQEKNRREAKEAIKAYRQNKAEAKALESVKTPKQVTPSPKSVRRPQPFDFDTHLDAYHQTGDPAYLEAAQRHADMELNKEKLRLARSGNSGFQGHVDREWAINLHKTRSNVLKDLTKSPEMPKKGILSRIAAFFKEEAEILSEMKSYKKRAEADKKAERQAAFSGNRTNLE